jgi:hypothetical protein
MFQTGNYKPALILIWYYVVCDDIDNTSVAYESVLVYV